MWRGWVLAIRLKALCCFKYCLVASTVRWLHCKQFLRYYQDKYNPKLSWRIPLVEIKCRHYPNAPLFLTISERGKQKQTVFGAGCSTKNLWNILRACASPTMVVKCKVKSRSNVFFMLKNLSPNLSPSRMSLFAERFEVSVIWRQYSSQSFNGHLPTTDSKSPLCFFFRGIYLHNPSLLFTVWKVRGGFDCDKRVRG